MSSRILIVEDDAGAAALYQRVLGSHEHTVAETAEEAVDMLGQEWFDLIILDIHLPAASGLDVLQYLRSYPFATKVFVVTSDELQIPACERLGIEGWMTKPINVAQFVDTVHYLL